MLEANGIGHAFGAKRVLNRVSLHIRPGEIVGLGGPSGTGKSTLARVLAGYLTPQEGRLTIDGGALGAHGFCPVQMLFQSPELAVNPRWRVRDILNEAFSPDRTLLERFGVRGEWFDRYPHELSGGELQRVTIARCLDPRVRYLLADEISAMLDPLTQAAMWRSLLDVVRARGIGLLVISHDSVLLGRIADRQLSLGENGLIEVPKPAGLRAIPA